MLIIFPVVNYHISVEFLWNGTEWLLHGRARGYGATLRNYNIHLIFATILFLSI